MPTVIDEVANIFEFNFPDDDFVKLAAPSYLDIPKGILKKPSVARYAAMIHPCETATRVVHVCEAFEVKPK